MTQHSYWTAGSHYAVVTPHGCGLFSPDFTTQHIQQIHTILSEPAQPQKYLDFLFAQYSNLQDIPCFGLWMQGEPVSRLLVRGNITATYSNGDGDTETLAGATNAGSTWNESVLLHVADLAFQSLATNGTSTADTDTKLGVRLPIAEGVCQAGSINYAAAATTTSAATVSASTNSSTTGSETSNDSIADAPASATASTAQQVADNAAESQVVRDSAASAPSGDASQHFGMNLEKNAIAAPAPSHAEHGDVQADNAEDSAQQQNDNQQSPPATQPQLEEHELSPQEAADDSNGSYISQSIEGPALLAEPATELADNPAVFGAAEHDQDEDPNLLSEVARFTAGQPQLGDSQFSKPSAEETPSSEPAPHETNLGQLTPSQSQLATALGHTDLDKKPENDAAGNEPGQPDSVSGQPDIVPGQQPQTGLIDSSPFSAPSTDASVPNQAPAAPQENNDFISGYSASTSNHTPSAPAVDTPEPQHTVVANFDSGPDNLPPGFGAAVETQTLPAGQILAVPCPQGHENSTTATICRICQAPVNGEPRLVPIPSRGSLQMSTGEVIDLVHQSVIVGRSPSSKVLSESQLQSSANADHIFRLVKLDNQSISSTHAMFQTHGWEVTVADCDSTNGTYLMRPGQPRRKLTTTPVRLCIGDVVDFQYGYTFTVQGVA